MEKSKKILNIIAMVTIIGFGFTSCGDDDGGGGGHTHTYSTTWSSNSAQHWKECTASNCDAKIESANHAPADGVCTTCGYDNTPAHIHSYSTEWSSDETEHWKECTDASCDAETEIANHAPTDGICTTCGYDNTPVCITHNWGWASYVTGSGLRECQISGCTVKAGVGDTGPAGGKIIYAAASGFTVTGVGEFTAYYLEAAEDNLGSRQWSSTNQNVTGADGTAIGTGKANTAAILTTHSSAQASSNAAKAASEHNGGGKNDWFLPSINELNEMYKARTHLGISSGYFWSSTQTNTDNAQIWQFSGGSYTNRNKSGTSNQVRPVRAF